MPEASSSEEPQTPVARYALAQSVADVDLGILPHGFHVPWREHFLSRFATWVDLVSDWEISPTFREQIKDSRRIQIYPI